MVAACADVCVLICMAPAQWFSKKPKGNHLSGTFKPTARDYIDNYSKWFSEQQQEGNADDNTAGELPVEVHKLLVRAAIKKGDLGHAAWLVWQWALCSRSHNITNLRCHHFKCLGGYVKVQHDRVKTGGHQVTSPKHCYQSPFVPEACCDFVLGLYLCSTRDRQQEEDPKIFVGAGAAHQVFNSYFVDLVKELEGEISQIASGKNLSPHSIRKGSGTAGANGATAAPSVISICRRGDWSIGQVLGRCLKWAAAQDQCLGRVLALLPSCDGRFATPAAHWNDGDGTVELARAAVEEVFGANYPVTFQPMLRRCLASMVSHSEWVMGNLPATHCARCNPLHVAGSGEGALLAKLKAVVSLEASSSGTPTGIPPCIFNLIQHEKTVGQLSKLAAEQQSTNTLLRGLTTSLVAEMKAFLEQRAVEQNVVTISGLTGHLDSQREVLESAIMKRLEEQEKKLMGLVPRSATPAEVVMVEPATDSTAATGPGSSGSSCKVFLTSTGPKHMPGGWKFPRVTLRDGWRLWVKGMPAAAVRPFRKFADAKMVHKKQVNTLHEWRMIFRKLESLPGVDVTKPTDESFRVAMEELKGLVSYCWAKKGDCGKWLVPTWAKAVRPDIIRKRGAPEGIEKLMGQPQTFRNKKRHRTGEFHDAVETV